MRTVFYAALLAVALAAPASAGAAPFALGEGQMPGVAVDGAGTAYRAMLVASDNGEVSAIQKPGAGRDPGCR